MTLSDATTDFTNWCRQDIFTPDLIRATALLQTALDIHLIEIYARLGLQNKLSSGSTAAQLVNDLEFVESADRTLEAILERLSARFDFVERSAIDNVVTYRHVGEIPTPARPLADIEDEMSAFGDDFIAPLEFLKFGNQFFEYSLKDDPDYLDKILSGRESENQELWYRATNVDPLQNVHGIMGAKAIDLLFDEGEILEIGGGTGNGIRNLLAHFAAKNELARIHRYVFTDISAKFIMGTRHEIMADYPDVATEWRFADLNKPLRDQKIESNRFDLIYAVNAAHVAKDIVAFLESCRESLKPGGRVLFAERIRMTPRDMAPRELALNLSVYHRTAANRNDDYRPMHCYLSPENWLRVFELAGFKDGQVWPDIESLQDTFPDQYASVVTAVA